MQQLLDPALPEDIEDGLDEETVTFSIGEALDHIGEHRKVRAIFVGARLCRKRKIVCPGQSTCCGHPGFGRFHVMLLFYCGCAWAADAVEMMLLSFLGPAVSPLLGCMPSIPAQLWMAEACLLSFCQERSSSRPQHQVQAV